MSGTSDILQWASREFILSQSTVDEQISFIEDQIADPFNSGGTNHLKKLSKMVSSKDEMDDYCARFFTKIQDVYPNLTIDVSEFDLHLVSLFGAIYKFFVKNVDRVMYVFIREFIFNNKNRKMLVSEFMTTKISNYPKEQYGKKEYYVLVTKLQAIVNEIFEDDVSLKKFISYVSRNSSPVYVEKVEEALERGLIIDNGVVSDMYKMYKKSDDFRSAMNRLEMEINDTFITPYLEDNGMMEIRLPPTEDITPDLATEDEEEENDNDDDQ